MDKCYDCGKQTDQKKQRYCKEHYLKRKNIER